MRGPLLRQRLTAEPEMKRPSQRRLNQFAGVLFLLSAAMWFALDNVALASTNVTIGVVFLLLSRSDS